MIRHWLTDLHQQSFKAFVPLSIRLGTGPDGYSYLLAGAALGAVLGAGLASRLAGASRLAPVIMGALCLQALPYLATAAVNSPAVAALLQVASGTGMVIVDVLAITSLQRDLPGAVLSRVLGIFDTLLLGAVLLASLAAGVLLAHAGVNVALIAVGLGVPFIGLAGLPALLRIDRRSAAEAERLRPRAQEPVADDGFSRAQRQRDLYLQALPHHLAWIAERARAGDTDAVADEARRLADDSDRAGQPSVARVSATIANDADRGILSQPKLMQLVLLAAAAGGGR